MAEAAALISEPVPTGAGVLSREQVAKARGKNVANAVPEQQRKQPSSSLLAEGESYHTARWSEHAWYECLSYSLDSKNTLFKVNDSTSVLSTEMLQT